MLLVFELWTKKYVWYCWHIKLSTHTWIRHKSDLVHDQSYRLSILHTTSYKAINIGNGAEKLLLIRYEELCYESAVEWPALVLCLLFLSNLFFSFFSFLIEVAHFVSCRLLLTPEKDDGAAAATTTTTTTTTATTTKIVKLRPLCAGRTGQLSALDSRD